MAEAVASKALSVGDLIGRSVRFFRVNIPLIVQVLMWPTIISIAGKVGLNYGLTLVARRDLSQWPLAFSLMGVGAIIIMVTSFFLILRNLALVRLANGFAANYPEAYKAIKGRMGSILLLIIIGYVILFGGILLWGAELAISAIMFKPGSALIVGWAIGLIFGIVGIIATILLFYLIGLVALSIIACEERGFGSVISRGFSLTFNDFGRALLFGLLLLVTVMTLSYPLSLPAVLLSAFEAFRHGLTAATAGDPAKMPLYVIVVSQAWESMVNMLLWPLTWLSAGLFYYDLRIRQEGIDVLQSLRLLEAGKSS